jgi:ABC-type phosphate/phosphonate transport system substrate-binding protein
MFLCLSLPFTGPNACLSAEQLHAAFTQHAFNGVNRADAEAAFKVITRTMGVKRGYDVAVTVRMFERVPELDAELEAGAINLLVLDTWTYLELNTAGRLEPAFVSSDASEVAKQQLLLTRRDSGLHALAALRGKTLNVQSASNANLGVHWLQTVCGEQNLGAPADFFGPMEYLAKPSSVVLPVFFGRTDACLVDSTSLALMAELNPQVGRNLQVIASSEPMVDSVVCLSESGWSSPQFRRDLREVLGELHLEPAGQQILTLFRSGRLMPFEERHLDTVRKLRAHATAVDGGDPNAAGSPRANTAVTSSQP